MTQNNQITAWGLDALRLNREARRNQLEAHAPHREHFIQRNEYYYDGVKRLLRYIVEPGKRVLEIRCATGHLLGRGKAELRSRGRDQRQNGRDRPSQISGSSFLRSDPEALELDEKFDDVVFSHIFDTVDLLARWSACANVATGIHG